MPRHDWNTLNRDVHGPDDISAADVVEEVRAALAALTDEQVRRLVNDIDHGYYPAAGRTLTRALEAVGQPRGTIVGGALNGVRCILRRRNPGGSCLVAIQEAAAAYAKGETVNVGAGRVKWDAAGEAGGHHG